MKQAHIIEEIYPEIAKGKYEECIPIFEQSEPPDYLGLSSIYINLIKINQIQEKYDYIDLCEKGLDNIKKIKTENIEIEKHKKKNTIILHRAKSIYYRKKKRYDLALKEIDLALYIAHRNLKFHVIKSIISDLYETKGNIFFDQKQYYKAALSYIEQKKYPNDFSGLMHIKYNLSICYYFLGNKELKNKYLNEALIIARNLNDYKLIDRIEKMKMINNKN